MVLTYNVYTSAESLPPYYVHVLKFKLSHIFTESNSYFN